MKKWGKFEIGILLFFLFAFGLDWALTASGILKPKQRILVGGELSIDFTQSNLFQFDFSNGSGFKNITVSFTSCKTTGSSAAVRVTLYVDQENDGNYLETQHTAELTEGDSITMYLPYQRKKYRLIFSSENNVQKADFIVKSGQPGTGYRPF